MMKRMGIIAALGFVSLGAASCSKNEAASSHCSGATDTSSCERCCKENGANGYAYAGSCGCLGGATAPASASPSVSFAGTYQSTWGPTVFVQSGNSVTAQYPDGSMNCAASGNTLDCAWREGARVGKARLVKDASGSMKGTWGNDSSATDGGPWVFSP